MNKVRYYLTSKSQGRKLLLTDPNGWDNDTRSLNRETKNNSFGILYDFATDLTFTKDGYDYINAAERAEGFEASIRCERWVRNFNDQWELNYVGYIHLLTKKETRTGVTVSLTYGGVTETLESNLNEEYTLSRSEDLDGNDIGLLTLQDVLINGRDLNVVTLLEDNESKTIQGTADVLGGGTLDNIEAYYIPILNKTYSGDDRVQQVISSPLKPLENNNQFRPDLNSTHPFIFRSDEEAVRTLEIDIDCDVTSPTGTGDGTLFLIKSKYISDTNQFEYVGGTTLKTLSFTESFGTSQTITVNETFITNEFLEDDESLTLLWYFRTAVNTGSNLLWQIDQRVVKIDMQQTSAYQATKAQGLTLYNAAKRLSEITVGKNVVKSDYLTTGNFKDLIVTNGKRLRGFGDSIEMSFKKLFQSTTSVLNCYYGVEQTNNEERIVIENLDYFFRPKIGLELGKVSDSEETYKEDLINSSIDIGYTDGGDYEEEQGLDEYNTNTNFTFNFKKVDNPRDAKSDFRADTIGIELTRRKPLSDFPTEDTQEDKDNFLIDCYKSGDYYINRPYALDFLTAPTGMFSPLTAYNLRLTPKNNLYRISNSLSYLSYYPNKSTIFVNSFRNSEVTTQLIGKEARTENESVINSELNRPLFQPYQITCKVKLTDDQLSYLTGRTDDVPNYYNLISFISDKGVKQYGYLLSYEPNDEGTLTLLKANFTQSEIESQEFEKITMSSDVYKMSSDEILTSTVYK